MYTEICHYLLFHLTLSAILWVLWHFVSLMIDHLNTTLRLKKKTSQNPNPGDPIMLQEIQRKKPINRFSFFYKKKISQLERNDWAEKSIMSKIWLSSFFLFLSLSFFGTINNYISSDFSIYNTTTNSTADIPLFYKISATWSNHEGSLLLWCWLLSFSAFLFFIWTLQSTKMEYFSRFNFYSLKQQLQIHLAKKKNDKGQKSRTDPCVLSFTNHKFSSPFLSNFYKTEPVYKFSNNSVLKKNFLHSISEKMIGQKLKQNFTLCVWKKFFHSTFILDEALSSEFRIIKKEQPLSRK